MDNFEKLGFMPADILLPKETDMEKWSVVACDQFTSEPEYWETVKNIVGDAPSALKLILPEAGLGNPGVSEEIGKINSVMNDYLEKGLFENYEDALIYVERTQSDGKVRKGIVGKIDLDDYDFVPGNTSLIRATEGTVLKRIPPRVKVRENAPIELPHVMLLIDDPEKTVIEPLEKKKDSFRKLYDFELMQGGGHIKGFLIDDASKAEISEALCGLTKQEVVDAKYGIPGAAPMLFAVGDGNHSLATAKKCYEDQKKVTPESEWINLLSKYALVEVVNNHDEALSFEPIHRVVFGCDQEALLDEFLQYFGDSEKCVGLSPKEVRNNIGDELPENTQLIGYCYDKEEGTLVIPNPKLQLAVGSLQEFLDKYLEKNPLEVDYIHGDEVVTKLGKEKGNIGFLLPAMSKEQLFKTVMADGVLPRKTFSMGHAQDKRYYTEARRIR